MPPTVHVDPLDSPCIGVCTLRRRGEITVCGGCWRTMAEISRWRDMDRPERATVLAACAARRASSEK